MGRGLSPLWTLVHYARIRQGIRISLTDQERRCFKETVSRKKNVGKMGPDMTPKLRCMLVPGSVRSANYHSQSPVKAALTDALTRKRVPAEWKRWKRPTQVVQYFRQACSAVATRTGAGLVKEDPTFLLIPSWLWRAVLNFMPYVHNSS